MLRIIIILNIFFFICCNQLSDNIPDDILFEDQFEHNGNSFHCEKVSLEDTSKRMLCSIYKEGVLHSKGIFIGYSPVGKHEIYNSDGDIIEIREFYNSNGDFDKPNQYWVFDEKGNIDLSKSNFIEIICDDTVSLNSTFTAKIVLKASHWKNRKSQLYLLAEIEETKIDSLYRRLHSKSHFINYKSKLLEIPGENTFKGIVQEFIVDTINDSTTLKHSKDIYFEKKYWKKSI